MTQAQQLSFAVRAVNEAKKTLDELQSQISGVGDAAEKAQGKAGGLHGTIGKIGGALGDVGKSGARQER